MPLSRRSFLLFGSALALPLVRPARAAEVGAAPDAPAVRVVPEFYPTQDPDLVREMVAVSHGNVARVRELVQARPSLARAAWDWGFGDWETALGAASHVGNREIAEYLIENGARPTLFSATMLGQLDVVQAFVRASPGVQRIRGPHGIPLLAHARAGRERAAAVVAYLESLDDADRRPPLQPLDQNQIAQVSGVYAFGSLADERIEIASVPVSPAAPPRTPGAELSFTRGGRALRQLFHLGQLVFHPAGAEAVRIRFEVVDGAARSLTVHDPEIVLRAERVGA